MQECSLNVRKRAKKTYMHGLVLVSHVLRKYHDEVVPGVSATAGENQLVATSFYGGGHDGHRWEYFDLRYKKKKMGKGGLKACCR